MLFWLSPRDPRHHRRRRQLTGVFGTSFRPRRRSSSQRDHHRNLQGSPAPETYHPGVEVSGDVRTLYIAGQIGVQQNGTIPQGIEAQARAAYANLNAVLDSEDLGFADVVKTTVFLVNPDDRAFAAIRSEATGGSKNASTLASVVGLALPELLIEVEAIAVKAVSR